MTTIDHSAAIIQLFEGNNDDLNTTLYKVINDLFERVEVLEDIIFEMAEEDEGILFDG